MNFKYKALLLFVILLLGLILCSFLGGNCGINHREGFTKKTTTTSGNLNTVATYYGPNGNTAQIVKNANNTYSIVVGDCSGNDCSGNDVSGNDVSGSMIDCSCNYTIYTSSTTSTSYELTVFYGTNGGVARVIRVDNGNTAIEITLPNGTIELFTVTKTPYYTKQNYPKFDGWPSTQPQQQPNQNYDNYNHYSGLSVSTVYYGPNGATAKVVETANSYNIIVTYPNGQTSIFSSNTNVSVNNIYVTTYYGSNGGKAVFINNSSNGQYALEVTLPNGTAILFTVNNPQTFNPDYINNTSYGTSNTSGSYNSSVSSNSYVYPPATSNNSITSTIYYGPYGATARIVQTADSYYIIVTYPNGQTTIYKTNNPVNSNNIYITIYYGENGGKAVFINGNSGNYALEITMPNGNIILFTVTPTTTSNNYDSSANTTNTTNGSPYNASTTPNTYNTTNTYPGAMGGMGAMGAMGGMGGMGGASSSYNYSSSLPPGIPGSQIPPGSEDLYILKSEVVPPVCPACPILPCNVNGEKETCPPCPACARCPQPNFDCKKVPNYDALAEEYIPVPVLNDFSQFGM